MVVTRTTDVSYQTNLDKIERRFQKMFVRGGERVLAQCQTSH